MASNRKKKLFVEASAIAEPRPSGIGHSIVATLKELSAMEEFTDRYQIILLVPGDMKKNLQKWGFPSKTVKIRSIGLEKHVLQVLLKYNLLPPMDIFLGRGLYLFPNYKTWPLMLSKSITYIYDVAFAIFPETVQAKNLRMLQMNIPRWVKRADLVITISQTSRKEISKYLGIPDSKIGIVYCGVDQTEFNRRPKSEIAIVKRRYGIDGSYILFVGNIEPRKNLDRLLEAYATLPDDIRDKYSLVLIGGGGWLNDGTLSRIESLRKQGLRIIHPDTYIPDGELPILFSGASIVVHPAIHEGFGIPPLQAMACQTPVAVSDIGAIREVVADYGVYFDPNDVDSIASAIKKLIKDTDLQHKLVINGLKRSSQFSWQQSAKQLASYIESMG